VQHAVALGRHPRPDVRLRLEQDGHALQMPVPYRQMQHTHPLLGRGVWVRSLVQQVPHLFGAALSRLAQLLDQLTVLSRQLFLSQGFNDLCRK